MTLIPSLKRTLFGMKDSPEFQILRQNIFTNREAEIRFYNQKCPHRTLSNLSPCQFEEKFLANRASEAI